VCSVAARALDNLGESLHVEGRLASANEILDELKGVVFHLTAALVIGGHQNLKAVEVAHLEGLL